MIDSEYYQDYKGPDLTSAILNEKEDITKLIKTFYGEGNNWEEKLWTYKEVFGEGCKGSKYYCEFHSEEGRKHWFHGFVNDEKMFFNPPLHTPINQINENKL